MKGYLVLVEGESDCWTLWFHGFPVLGIPGADMAGKLSLEYLEGIRNLYILREPDKGGKTFVAGMARRLQALFWDGKARIVELPGAKDPNDLHRCNPEGFKDASQAAMDSASPLELPGESVKIEQQKISLEQVAQARQELSRLQAEEAEEADQPVADWKAIEGLLRQALQSEDPLATLEQTVVPALARFAPFALDDATSKVVKAYREGGHAIGLGTLKKEVKAARQKADQARGVRQGQIGHHQETICIYEGQLADPEGQTLSTESLDVEEEEGEKERKRRSMADRLIDYALNDPKQTLLFCDQHGAPHALVGGQPVSLTPRCHKWLRRLIWEYEGKSATGEASRKRQERSRQRPKRVEKYESFT